MGWLTLYRIGLAADMPRYQTVLCIACACAASSDPAFTALVAMSSKNVASALAFQSPCLASKWHSFDDFFKLF